MIPALELYPDRRPVVKKRDDVDDAWGEMRIDGNHTLGERAGVASYTLLRGWIHKLPEGLPEEMKFVCVPERGLDDMDVVGVLNTVNITGLLAALMALFFGYSGELVFTVICLAVVAVYVWFIQRIRRQINTARDRSRERLFKAHGKEVPKWVTTQRWVSRTDSEIDAQLFARLEELQGEMIGYDVGLACTDGQAWLVVDDPDKQGAPLPLGKDRLFLLEAPEAETSVPAAAEPPPATTLVSVPDSDPKPEWKPDPEGLITSKPEGSS